jgi:creatinine amidohydrolase
MNMTRDEVREAAESGAVAVLPIGAVEQHGGHLPTGTDAFIAARTVIGATLETGDVALPPLLYGCSLGHTEAWPGTLSLSAQTLTATVVEIGRWVHASGFTKLLVVNSHATNGPPAQSALLTLRYETPGLKARFVSLFDFTREAEAAYFADASDPHANEAETSLIMHLDPNLVRTERITDEVDRTLGRVLNYAMPDVTVSGVVGSPSLASPLSGATLFTELVSGLRALLTRARAETFPNLDAQTAVRERRT